MEFHTVYRPAKVPGTVNDSPSETRQEFKDECDINLLVARFEKTGSFYNPLSPMKGEVRVPEFLDCSNLPDFLDAQKLIATANEQFAALPAVVRSACNNDPAALLAALNDPVTRPQMASLLGMSNSGVQGTPSPATAIREGKLNAGNFANEFTPQVQQAFASQVQAAQAVAQPEKVVATAVNPPAA